MVLAYHPTSHVWSPAPGTCLHEPASQGPCLPPADLLRVQPRLLSRPGQDPILLTVGACPAEINALKQHIQNLLTPSTPFFFNTLYDPFAEGADFVRGYPFSMREGAPTAISHGGCLSSALPASDRWLEGPQLAAETRAAAFSGLSRPPAGDGTGWVHAQASVHCLQASRWSPAACFIPLQLPAGLACHCWLQGVGKHVVACNHAHGPSGHVGRAVDGCCAVWATEG